MADAVRLQVAENIRARNRYPVIVSFGEQRRKFMALGDMSLTLFMLEVRKVMGIGAEERMIVARKTIDAASMPPKLLDSGTLISALYELHREDDGFMYIEAGVE